MLSDSTRAARPDRERHHSRCAVWAAGALGSIGGVTRTPTTDEWGIDASWLDALEDRAPIVARPGDVLEVDEAEVTLEDGSTRHVDGELPDDFPLGYHWLQAPGGPRRRLVDSPGRCSVPDHRRWGGA